MPVMKSCLRIWWLQQNYQAISQSIKWFEFRGGRCSKVIRKWSPKFRNRCSFFRILRRLQWRKDLSPTVRKKFGIFSVSRSNLKKIINNVCQPFFYQNPKRFFFLISDWDTNVLVTKKCKKGFLDHLCLLNPFQPWSREPQIF